MGETSSGSFPFSDVWSNGFIRRTFLAEVIDEELIWHRDHKDRFVRVIESKGWKLQMDNELPIDLEEGKMYTIKAMQYHRILKGNGNLVLEIREEQ